ncbi:MULTISPECIES: STY4851/ECs_5259 family protein [Glaesserella]|uniref:Uncharacterized protein n=1 Tax=Glaesserella australis TaxID=2094024 RepID=A0A328C1U0_9PAST|nr:MULTISPECIES: STY4851/ECs_5259 family protein [Glaesserella]AUI65544.1 hypothetical protein CJD39_02635 [Glaesserella sp. 15-184]RAL19741.1 hypothetical protein C5N92_01720 [Glaesserella australis]
MSFSHDISYWMRTFFTSRELERSTGKPLYTYRMLDSEFSQLQTLLSQSKLDKSDLDRTLSAAFCLYCAEWYRREYRSGWTWSGIEQSLNQKLDSNIRTRLIQQGFAYWKREIVQYTKNHHSYLGSVYREGGLPYTLLISENSRFQELFRNILAFYSQNPQVVLDPLLLLPYLTYFPEALKNETTLSLITEMATKIAYLVEKYDLSLQTSPAHYLDIRKPDWKVDFPIPLNNETADKLLLSLLDTAVKVRRNHTKDNERYTLIQTLINTEEFKFKVEIKLAKLITIKSQYHLTQARCVLSLYEGNECLTNISSAYVISSHNERYDISLRQTYALSYRKNPKLPIFLVLEQQGVIVYKELLAESEIDVAEMPLVLNADTPPKVIGLGSVHRKMDTFHVVLAEQASIEIQDEYSELIAVTPEENGLKHYLLSGKAVVKYQNEKFHISSHNEKLKKQFRLVGSMLPYFTPTGCPIYLGLPKISQLDDEFRLDMGQGHSVYGEKYVRILDQSDNLLFKQKIAVLPEDFRIKFSKSKSPKEGIIEFYSEKNFIIYKPNSSLGIESEIIKNQTGYNSKHLLVRNLESHKSKLQLGIGINLQSKVDIILPFPSSGVQVLDHEDQEVSIYHSLSLHELLGSRVRLYPDIGTATNYSIDLKNSHNNFYCFQYLVKDSPLDINLNEFKPEIMSLFSVSKNLDEQVKLIISQNNCVVRQINLTLYATDLILQGNEIKMKNPSEKIQLELLSLTSLECTKLNKDINGNFILPNELDSPSLILSNANSDLKSRAIFIPATSKFEVEGDLQQAIVLPPSLYSKGIQEVLNRMVEDLNHSGWDYLSRLYQKFSYLPLSTFFVWKELIKNNKALTAFVLKYPKTEHVMEHLQYEFNVIWSLVPINMWSEQIIRFRQSLNSLPEIIIESLINNKLEQIKRFSPSFRYSEKPITREMMKRCFSGWYQELHNKNLERFWISDFGTELASWARDKGIDLNIQFEYKEQAVIFFPFFAAAVTCGKESFDSLRSMEDKDFYTFKMLMEFDIDWFNSIYLCAIQLFKDEER